MKKKKINKDKKKEVFVSLKNLQFIFLWMCINVYEYKDFGWNLSQSISISKKFLPHFWVLMEKWVFSAGGIFVMKWNHKRKWKWNKIESLFNNTVKHKVVTTQVTYA